MCFTWRSNNETAWCAEGPEFDSGQNLFFFPSFFFSFPLRLVFILVFVVFFYFFIWLMFFLDYKFSSILLYSPFNFLPFSRVLREILRFTYFQLKGLFHSVYRVFSRKFVFYCRFVAARQLWVVCNREKILCCDTARGRQSRRLACFRSHVLPAYWNFESTQLILATPK